MKFVAVFIGLLIYCVTGLFVPVHASSNFSTSYDQTYKINADGSADVAQVFSVVNLTSETMATRSVVFLPYQNVSDLYAYDPSGPLKMTVTHEEAGVNLAVTFNNPAAGLGQKYSWYLSFTTHDLVRKFGHATDIILPQIQLPESVSDFTERVVLNQTHFGKLTYLWPNTPTKLEWSKSAIGNGNVHLIYSTEPHQPYNLALTYLLANKKLYPQTLEIPLFSNSQSQKVQIKTLSPKPLDVVVDSGGTWLAKYYLGPSSKLTISSEVVVDVSPTNTEISNQEVVYPTSPQTSTLGLAKKLGSPENIYRYVVGLFKKDSSCQEITLTFAQLVSNLGVPARTISGLVYPENQHLHCWAEYYDAQTGSWHQVDPQLEITTGADYFSQWDPYHLRLKATNFGNPIAGVPLSQIDFKASLDPFASESANLAYQADFPSQVFSGFSLTGKVVVTNVSGVEFPGLEISPVAQFLKPKQAKIKVGNLPPFGRRVVSVEFAPQKDWMFSGNDIISLAVQGKAYSYAVALIPFYSSPVIIIAFGIVLATIVFTLTKISWRLLLQRRSGDSHIHR